MREMGLPAERDWFDLRCDDHNVLWELIRAGCGFGFGQLRVGEADPLVERLMPELPLPSLPVWLTAPDAACLDFSVAKGGLMGVYRWDGEAALTPDRLIGVDAEGAVRRP